MSWSTDASAWAAVGGLAAASAVGLARLRRSSAGRRFVPTTRLLVAGLGFVGLIAAILSPLEGLAGRSVAAHMVQHLVLLLVVAPAFVYGRVAAALGAAAPRHLRQQRRRRAGTPWTRPLVAAALLAATWWTWHIPPLYRAAVEVAVVHAVEHATMLVAAWLFWAVVLDPARRSEAGATAIAVFGTGLQMAAMAALLTFPGTPWLAGTTVRGPLAPVADQTVAGGMLWFPAGAVWAVTGAALIARWINDDEALAG